MKGPIRRDGRHSGEKYRSRRPSGSSVNARARLGTGGASVDRPGTPWHHRRVPAQFVALESLSKNYGRHTAVENMSLSIARGEIVGLLGPNGAGKSTTIAMLTGLLTPSRGKILCRTAHRISGAFRLIFTGALLGILFSNPDFQWTSDSVRIFLFQHPMLLLDEARGGFLGALGSWSPSVWIFHGWVAAAVASMIAALGLYVLSLRGMFDAAGGVRSPRPYTKVERVRGTSVAAVIYRHELRYLASSPGGVVAMGAGIAAGAWLLGSRHPSTAISLFGGFLALAAAFAYPANTFGHDGHALRRYALLGPDWGLVFAAKNRAWLTVMGVSLALPIASDAARVSVASGVSLLLAAGLVLALAIVWGNVSSMLLPSRHGTGQAPAFVNQIAPFGLCALPLGIHLAATRFGSITFDVAVGGGLVAAIALYAFLLRRISRSFDADVENVLARF
jgi:hypothetical protein